MPMHVIDTLTYVRMLRMSNTSCDDPLADLGGEADGATKVWWSC